MSRVKMLAMASGFVAGGFLFLRCYQEESPFFRFSNSLLWDWQWYEVALLLSAIGLVGVFPSAWLRVTVSLGLGVYFSAILEGLLEPGYHGHFLVLPPWLVALVWGFPMSFLAPLAGGAIGRRLSRTRIPRSLYFALLAIGLGLGGSLPAMDRAQRRRLETQELPALLKRIYEAEMAYSAARSDKHFTCDPTQLPAVAALNWRGERRFAMASRRYFVQLDCSYVGPYGFRVAAASYSSSPHFSISIDETGELLAGPAFDAARQRRMERRDLPAFLKRIYEAEMAYRAIQPDKSFTCDVNDQLPAVRERRWDPGWNRSDLYIYYTDGRGYNVELHCPGGPGAHQFQVTATPRPPDTSSNFFLSIDQTGELVTVPDRRSSEPIRVDGGVQARKLVKQTPPVYVGPAEVICRGKSGAVHLTAIIGKDGAVREAHVDRGDVVCRPATLDAVKYWVYAPTILNGRPVEVITQIEVKK